MHHHRLRGLIVLILLVIAGAAPGRAGSTDLTPATARLQARLEGLAVTPGCPVYLRIFKLERLLEVWLADSSGRFHRLKTYPICAYGGFPGPKLAEGDAQSPEGFYTIQRQQLHPDSQYHLALDVGYPNEFDRFWQRSGSSIMIHGDCSSVGCFAMGNQGIEEIYLLVERALPHQGEVPIHIFPFRLTDDNLDKFSDSPWIDFWWSLELAYRLFETQHRVPRILVQQGQYRIAPSPATVPSIVSARLPPS
jgi:murein L,D-transpeptidase YafK